MRIHLMGLGGSGMSALAKLLKGNGHEISGCDLKEPYYKIENIKCELGHSIEHIKNFKPDILVCSSAVDKNCDEILYAKNNNVKIISRAMALSDMFNIKKGIGIAGAHGKTTTSSMTGLIFLKSNLNPTIYVGANVPDIGSNAISGSGEFFIAELDESDGSFELFHPEISIITNADWDHVDHFHTRNEVIEAFTRFSNGRKKNGTLIICAEDEGANEVFSKIDKKIGPVIRYGFGKSFDWGAYDIFQKNEREVSCRISHKGKEIGILELKVPGEHNILNSLAAIAAAEICGIDFEKSSEILKNFHGSERRMQIKGIKNGILIIDDYAHHPTEISATLNALKKAYPKRKIIVIYQPHRYTRTAMFAPKIAEALCIADEKFLMPVYSAGEKEISGVDSNEIIKLSDGKIKNINFDDGIEILKSHAHEGDIILTMGAGDVYKLGEKFLNENF